MMQDFNLSEKMGYSGKGLDFLKQTTMTNILEQAADAWVEKYSFRVPYDGSNNFYDEEAAKHGRAGFIAGATSPAAKAYNGQGWVSVEEMGNFAEWVRCNYIKAAQGYMHRMASTSSYSTKYYQMGDLIKMYLEIKPIPSAPNEKK